MASYLRKYATGSGADIYINIPKAGSANHAVGADWTPAAGDVKVSIDGGAAANIGTLPTAVAMGNSAIWKFVFTNAELTGKIINVTVSDSATKAVDDTGFSIETFGNASALMPFDLTTATQPVNVTQLLGTAWLTPATAGTPDVNTKLVGGQTASASGTVTFPNATLASTTNITAGTVTTATNVTTVNGLAANVITAASIAADAITAAKVAADVSLEIADAVWDEALSGHLSAGSTGEALNAAGSAGDPWTTSLPGAYTGSQAGKMLSDVLTDTAVIGAAGAGLTAVPWNAAWDAEVESEVNDALVVTRLDELLAADSDIDGAAPPTVGSVFHELLSKTAGSFTYDQTTDSLEAVRDNMGTAQTGDAFARLGAPAGASVSADVAAVKVDTAATLVDTNELQTDWVNGGRLDLILDARASQTSVDTIDDFLDTEIAAILAAVDTEVAAIKAKTDSLTFTTANRVDSQVFGAQADTITASALAADAATEISTAVFARAFSAAYGSLTFDEMVKIIASACAAKVSGAATTTMTFRNLGDTANVIVATVDADGNRSAVTLTP